ncbi:hypothetical protein ACFL5I_00705 [Planctomycetota bacterium]
MKKLMRINGGAANELLNGVKIFQVDALVWAVPGRDLFNINEQPQRRGAI